MTKFLKKCKSIKKPANKLIILIYKVYYNFNILKWIFLTKSIRKYYILIKL
jgi:hypothetical protein